MEEILWTTPDGEAGYGGNPPDGAVLHETFEEWLEAGNITDSTAILNYAQALGLPDPVTFPTAAHEAAVTAFNEELATAGGDD